MILAVDDAFAATSTVEEEVVPLAGEVMVTVTVVPANADKEVKMIRQISERTLNLMSIKNLPGFGFVSPFRRHTSGVRLNSRVPCELSDEGAAL